MKDMNKSPKNKDSFVILIKYQLWGWRRCGGLKWSESLPLHRSPVLGSNHGPGLPTVWSEGRQIASAGHLRHF